MANRETDIHNRILVALTQRFHPVGIFWRQNAGRVKTDRGAWVALGPPGISDIVGVVQGRSVFVEVKTDKGTQRTGQAAFQKAVEQAGGIYTVVRSPEEAVATLMEHLRR
ncbi:hypothetical protein [Paracoccus sp. SSK6]|uniref:hypothetical protein n=1 Tax=Paracoccus sp. SSK6 TaxID=3143131 RepID=UPI003219C1EF